MSTTCIWIHPYCIDCNDLVAFCILSIINCLTCFNFCFCPVHSYSFSVGELLSSQYDTQEVTYSVGLILLHVNYLKTYHWFFFLLCIFLFVLQLSVLKLTGRWCRWITSYLAHEIICSFPCLLTLSWHFTAEINSSKAIYLAYLLTAIMNCSQLPNVASGLYLIAVLFTLYILHFYPSSRLLIYIVFEMSFMHSWACIKSDTNCRYM